MHQTVRGTSLSGWALSIARNIPTVITLRFVTLANEPDIDFVLHLGDSIYERTGGKAYLQRPHADRLIALPSGGDIAVSPEDYRYLYRLYRSDAGLSTGAGDVTLSCFNRFDHELTNNAYWDAQNRVMGVSRPSLWRIRIFILTVPSVCANCSLMPCAHGLEYALART